LHHVIGFTPGLPGARARPPALCHGHAAADLLRSPRPLLRPRLSSLHPLTDTAPRREATTPDRTARDAQLADWLAAAAGGDAAAFERYYDVTLAFAHTLARRMLPAADVEDVIADAYVQAWSDVRRFDPARGSPVTWLLMIVRSRALDLLRRRKAAPEVAAAAETPGSPGDNAPSESPGPADLLDGIEAESRLHGALRALSAQERWVLGLAYYRELTHREVSEQTGLPLGTVKSLILRAQAKLRALLGETP